MVIAQGFETDPLSTAVALFGIAVFIGVCLVVCIAPILLIIRDRRAMKPGKPQPRGFPLD